MAPRPTDAPRCRFDETTTAKLNLVESRALDNGVVGLVYQSAKPAGDGADESEGEDQI